MARLILIADDADFALGAERHLVADGHEVDWHSSPFGVLTAVRKGAYDLIIVDIDMSGDAPRLLEYLHARGVGHTRIVLMSSRQRDLDDLAKNVGAHGCLSKAAGLRQLSLTVRESLFG